MEDYNRVLEATSVAENANGVAAEKMTVYNESLEAAQNRLTASIQQFAQDSNLDRILALAYDGLSKVVEILNILLNKIPVLSPLIKALGVALATAFAANMLNNLAKTSTGIGSIISTIGGAIPNLQAFVSLVGGDFVAAMTAAGGGLAGLKAGALAAGGAITTLINPTTLAIAGIGALLVLLPKLWQWFQNFENADSDIFDKASQNLEDANSDLKETQDQIKDIKDQISEIDAKDTLTLADKAEKDKLQEQLDILEDIKKTKEDILALKQVEFEDAANKTYGKKYTTGDIGSEEQYTHAKTSGTIATGSAYAAASNVTGKTNLYDAESASVSELVANIRVLNEEQQRLKTTEGDHGKELEQNNELLKKNKEQLEQRAAAIGEDITKMQEQGLTDKEYYENAVAQYNNIKLYLDPSKWGKLKLAELIDDSNIDAKLNLIGNKAREAVSAAATDTSKEAQDAADEAMKNLDKSITSSAQQLVDKISHDETLKQQFAQVFNINPDDMNLNELTAYIEQYLTEQYGKIATNVQDATSSILTSNGALKSTSDLLDEMGDRETDLASKTKSLSDAYNAMTKNGKITEAQMKALIKAYPELANAIEVQNGAIRVNINVLKEKYNTVIDVEKKFYQTQIDETNTVIEQTKKRIEAYQTEMAAMSEVLVGTRYVQTTTNDIMGTETSESSKSVESANTQLDYQIQKLQEAQANLKLLEGKLAGLESQRLTYTGTSSKSGTSQKDKEQKEFENSIKEKVKNLKAIVTLYSKQDNWSDPEVVKNFTNDYNKLLDEVINNKEARKVLAEVFNLDISKMSDEDQIKNLTTLWKDQAGTIGEAYDELAEKAAKALKEQSEAREKEYEEAVKNIQELQKLTVNMIETAIDLLEKAGDIVFSLIGKISKKYDKQIDALDKQMDNLDKIGDYLDKQKDAFDDKIDAQKEMLKLQKEEMDNADELADKNKSIADIDAQLMELQYDNSAEAQAKRLKLLDERAQKEKDLSDYQKDQAYDTKVSALDREKDAYDKNIEAQKKYIEEQKNALKEQQDAVKAAQEKFETNLDKAKTVFDGFIKIISSTVFKNLAANILDSLDGETLKSVLTSWNTWFGDGLKSTVENIWNKAFGSAKEGGWTKGKWLPDITNIFQKGQQIEGSIQKVISDALSSGKIDFSSLKNTVDSMQGSFGDFTKKMLQNITNVDGKTGSVIQKITSLGKNALDTVANSGNGIISNIATGIQKISQNGIGSILQIGNTGNGVLSSLGQGIKGILSNLANLPGIAGKAATTIGGLASKVGGLLGIGGSAAGGAGLAGIGSTLASVGSVLAPVALIGGAVAAGAVSGIESAKNIKGIWQSDDSVLKKIGKTAVEAVKAVNPITIIGRVGKKLLGKHHSGADYVKKQNPLLDKLLGLGNDETVSILKVGEAIVPKWANSASSSSSNTKYTGSSVSNAIATAVKSATAMLRGGTTSNTTDSSISISMPITIQGDASEATVAAFKKATNDIVNTVLKTINNQTRLGGYRNIKAATV